jgi:hypothetical protein
MQYRAIGFSAATEQEFAEVLKVAGADSLRPFDQRVAGYGSSEIRAIFHAHAG